MVILGLGLLLISYRFVDEPAVAGDAETDRQSDTLALAIGYPRQADAAGFARAALATTLGRSGDFSVLEAKDLEHDSLNVPMARLVWRIHRDEFQSDWNSRPAFDACYRVEFDYYGASSGPYRIRCPEHAVPIIPAPVPRRGIPASFVPALETALGKLPAVPSEADVRTALNAGLPAPPVDPETKLAAIPPDIFVRVSGADVGVALFARTGVEGKDCLMGRRLGGVVKVWSLGDRDFRMEKPCGADVALATP